MIYEKSWCDQRLSEHHAGPFVFGRNVEETLSD